MSTARVAMFISAVLLAAMTSILIIRREENPFNNFNTRSIKNDKGRKSNATKQDEGSRSTAKNLVVFNALGKINNLPLVEHSRRTIFQPDKWDCVAFMFAKEDRIPNNDTHIKQLRDELGCTITQTPGVMWGNFLQYISPTFVSNYDHVALVLDDMFIPDQGLHAVDVDKMIENMAKYDIQVMSPGIVGDTYNIIKRAEEEGLGGCIGEVQFIETYVQLFTRDAWTCFYKMLHYSGSRGWCYDMCFKSQCPELRLGQDYLMLAYHMDKGVAKIPESEINGTDLVEWEPEDPIVENGYQEINGMIICQRLGGCYVNKKNITKIVCPISQKE